MSSSSPWLSCYILGVTYTLAYQDTYNIYMHTYTHMHAYTFLMHQACDDISDSLHQDCHHALALALALTLGLVQVQL